MMQAGSRWSTSGTPNAQAISTTQKIKSISREARQNQLISERLNEWQAKMRGRGALSIARPLTGSQRIFFGTCSIAFLSSNSPKYLRSRQYMIQVKSPSDGDAPKKIFGVAKASTVIYEGEHEMLYYICSGLKLQLRR